ncbi:MAG: tRNA (adenosine(37)-N6)-threonylcarbamoyltransferase complex transferase subunit TsaD [Kiritimatiellae bacterium]|jgi:N6-L-threonylcarbamoyladenine synthase|nr:tRNA (adenosine(37)-N6)-threonylcarbamoyltransferase complex transferase subunit TsaD [Kiritimatiellia bacterium]
MIVLGIETSCDETSAAVVRDGRDVLASIVHTQQQHKPYGGVVPEIASRCHIELLPGIVDEAVAASGVPWSAIEAVAATRGPGLASSLLVGWSMAKGLARRLDVPLIAINHTEAHIHSVFLDPAAPDPHEAVPMLALAVSGGHTSLFRIPRYGEIALVGRTVDDAAGEALDKAAKLLGLGYPGGPIIDKLSRGRVADPRAFPEGRVREGVETGGLRSDLCLSFSGLKTALLHRVTAQPPADDDAVAQLAADYQEAVVQALVKRCDKALGDAKYLAVGGGVSLNSRLRVCLAELCARRGVRLLLALPKHCGDNAAMIAALAAMGRGITSPESFALDIAPSWAV